MSTISKYPLYPVYIIYLCRLLVCRIRSHLLRLPFRYAPLLEDYPENAEALPAVPPRVAGFEVAVSHTEWSERSLSEGALEAPMERVEGGVYQLPSHVTKQADGFPVEAIEFSQR